MGQITDVSNGDAHDRPDFRPFLPHAHNLLASKLSVQNTFTLPLHRKEREHRNTINDITVMQLAKCRLRKDT